MVSIVSDARTPKLRVGAFLRSIDADDERNNVIIVLSVLNVLGLGALLLGVGEAIGLILLIDVVAWIIAYSAAGVSCEEAHDDLA